MQTERNDWIDLIKAISIILVVYGHVARGVHTAGFPMDEQGFRLVDQLIYSFHMPLFFFAAGLLFAPALQRMGARQLIVRKARQLMYPYAVWSLIQGLIGVLLSRYTNSRLELAEVLSFPWHPRDQFWFLYALFLIFLVLAPLTLLLGRTYRLALPGLALAGFLLHQRVQWSFVDAYVLSFSIYVVLGMCFDRVQPFFRRHAGALSLGLGALFAAAQCLVQLMGWGDAGTDGWGLPLACLGILFFAALCIWLARWRPDWLCQVGRMSMPIFLMHVLAGSGTRIALGKLGVESAPLHLLAGTLAGVLLPLLAYRWLLRGGAGFLFNMPAPGGRPAPPSGTLGRAEQAGADEGQRHHADAHR
jgi:fucose 4-O-acetylase-like acetyltransferase